MLDNSLSLRKNLYIVPTQDGDKYIVYAPLQGFSFFCNSTYADELNEFISNGQIPQNESLASYISTILKESIEEPYVSPEINNLDKLLIILSQKCNLNCSYCFAQNSRSNEVTSVDKVKVCIDYILERNNGNQKTFTFIGGGEPLITWELLKESITYIENRAKECNVKYQIRIVTNATLLDEKRVQWLNRSNIVVSVSTDVLPDIQNSQRPFYNKEKSSFDYVDNALRLLHKYKIPHTLRATITELNVGMMGEMVMFSINNYPHIKRLHFEPVTDNLIDNGRFFNSFIDNFMKAYDICIKNGIYLTNSYITSFEHIKTHLCQGEMCLVPDGSIVACHRHSSNNDPLFKTFKYAAVKNNQVITNRVDIEKVLKMRMSRLPDCEQCLAKWHCAGGCTSKRQVYNKMNQTLHCEFTRNLIIRYIEYKLTHNN